MGEQLVHEPKPGVVNIGYGHAQPEGGEHILPLVLNMECTATQEEVERNIMATFERGYVQLMEHVAKYEGSVSLCGAGPSLGQRIDKLTGDVMAVNGAIKFLLDRGIVPRHAMLWDADKVVAEFAVPHPDITYFVASRCHPDVFERLRDCKVVVWHAGGDHDIVKLLEKHRPDEPMVQGGTTGVTRGIYLAFALGYKDFHIFGADSCYVDGATHVEGASKLPENAMRAMVGGRWFQTTAQWCAQIEEMKIIYPMLMQPEVGAHVTTYDDGMLSWVVSIMDANMKKALEEARATCELQGKKVKTQSLEEKV